MTVVDELKEQVESTSQKINVLVEELNAFAEIKSSLSSSDESLKQGIENFDSLQLKLVEATDQLKEVSGSLNTLVTKIADSQQVVTKIDDLKKQITELETTLTEKISKSGILGKLGFKS